MYTNVTHKVLAQVTSKDWLIKGAKYVCVCLQSEWFILGLPIEVTPLEVQFLDIVLEFQQYYNKKCTSHSRHYYY